MMLLKNNSAINLKVIRYIIGVFLIVMAMVLIQISNNKRMAKLDSEISYLKLENNNQNVVEQVSKLDIQIQQLQSTMDDIVERVKQIELFGQQTEKSIINLNNKLSNLETNVEKQLLSFNEQLNLLKNQFDHLQAIFSVLNQKITTQQKNTTQTNIPKTSPTPPKSPPPFRLINIENRGGIQFLAIAPHRNTSLSNIKLIEPGETIQGWQLLSIKNNQIRFKVSGKIRTLSLS